MKHSNANVYSYVVKYLLFYLAIYTHVNVFAEQHSVAVFQFTAGSFEAVGLEKELVYTVRNELRKQPDIILMNQRAMEVELNRNDIAQTFDNNQAIIAGQKLAVNYVVLGKVDRNSAQIVTNLTLVSTSSKSVLGEWVYRFRNQQEISSRASDIGTAIFTKITEHQLAMQDGGTNNRVVWLENLIASAQSDQVVLTWSSIDAAPESLGYNIYRSNAKSGPFSYLTSVLDPTHTDNVPNSSGALFYQVAMLTPEGDELRSMKVAKATIIQKTEVDLDLDAPTILSFTPLVKGIEIDFIAAAQNSGKDIDGFQLIRRSAAGMWKQVGFKALEESSKSSELSTTTRHKMRDKSFETSFGDVEYAIRAVKGNTRGEISEIKTYKATVAPKLQNATEPMVRKIKLAWQPTQNGNGYNIYRRDAGKNTVWRKLHTLESIEQSSYIDEDIAQDGQAYDYALTIFDQYSESAKSAVSTFHSRGKLFAPKIKTTTSGLVKKVYLNWQPIIEDQDVFGYAIFRTEFTDKGDITLTQIAQVEGAGVDTFIDDKQLQNGQSYYYAVAAINAFGNAGELSDTLKATTKSAPAPINNLQAHIVNHTVLLQWQYDHLDGIKGYILKRRWQGGSWLPLTELPANTMRYIDSDLMAGARVEYQIAATDNDHLVSETKTNQALTSPLTLNMLPASDGLLRENRLKWEQTNHVDGLSILRSQDLKNWREIATVDGLDTSYVDTLDLLDDTQYHYKLQSIYQQSLVTESNVVVAKTKDIPAPSSLQASNQVARKIELQWPVIVDKSIKSFMIFRRELDAPKSSSVVVGEVLIQSGGQFVDSIDGPNPIQHGVKYAYSIASKNIFDVIGPVGNEVVASSKPLPASPHNLIAKSVHNEIEVTWQVGVEQDLKSAHIFRKWEHQGDWQKLGDIDAINTKYIDSALLPYAKAAYKVELTNVDGLKSVFSKEVSLISPVTTLLNVQQDGLLRRIELAWENTNEGEHYQLMRSKDQITWAMVTESTKSNFIDKKGLVDETQYFYQLNIVDKQIKLGHSNIVTAKTKALPLPPLNINLKNNQIEKVTLNWSLADDKDIGGYYLYRAENDGTLKKLKTIKPSVAMYEDEGSFFTSLEHGTQYNYKLSSFNTHGVEGPKSIFYSARTKPLPQKVQNAQGQLADGRAALTWQANSEADIFEYLIYRSQGCKKVRKLVTVTSTTLEYTDTDVKSGYSYCYQISAVDSDKLESHYSDIIKITIPESGETQ